MLDPGIPRPRPFPLLTPRGQADRRTYTHSGRPGDFGLTITTSDSTSLQWSGYRLRVLDDRYLIEVWDRLSYRTLMHSYAATLTGEPGRLVRRAFGLTSWDDAADSGDGSWGLGTDLVSERATAPAIQLGLLLPASRGLYLS